MIYDYAVMDDRFHSDRSNAEIYFATNDLTEAKNVANEVAFHCVVVRCATDYPEDLQLVYDAALNTELALDA